MTLTEKRPRGRPPGRDYTERMMLKMRPEDLALVRALAAKWDVPVAEAFRRSMRQAARREKVQT